MMRGFFDWTKLSRDPIAPEVRAAQASELSARRGGRVFSKHEFVREFVTGRTTLDVGVVEHSMNHVDAEGWLHGKVKGWARSVVGVDILEAEVATLNARGFDVRRVDATSTVDLGQRFERVVMGDIIEHVNDPVALLRFGARHLAPGGLIAATTPNPLYLAALVESVRKGVTVANAEHVAAIAPTHALELGRRAGLALVEFTQIQTPASEAATWRLRSLFRLRDRLAPLQELFCHTYIYVFGAAGSAPV